MIKIQFEGTVKRIFDETRGGKTKKYVVVTDGAEQYPQVLRFKLKTPDTPVYGEGDKVKVGAYLDGREWTNDEGKIFYFTDLTVDTVEVLAKGQPGGGTDKPKTAKTWNALLALAEAWGETKDQVMERGKKLQEQIKRKFLPEDYQTIADEIVAAHDDNPFEDNDMPF
ncbi:MAG: DUF3127 domain-containing protein [Kiritimatiellae bacterium]|nr:DUF3127 domain-containing protein [Kiritimatiellia bacterium]